jgi:hypothetical protein
MVISTFKHLAMWFQGVARIGNNRFASWLSPPHSDKKGSFFLYELVKYHKGYPEKGIGLIIYQRKERSLLSEAFRKNIVAFGDTLNTNAFCWLLVSDDNMTRLTGNTINQDISECDLVG